MFDMAPKYTSAIHVSANPSKWPNTLKQFAGSCQLKALKELIKANLPKISI